VNSARPFLQEARQRGLAISPDQVRAQWDSVLANVRTPPELAPFLGGVGPLLSQISSAFSEVWSRVRVEESG